MLNDRQKQVLVKKVNEDLDIPWVTEGIEERIINKLVDRVAPKVEPSLLAIMPAVYVACIKLALDETVPLQERKDRISELMRAELAGPLARELNLRVDVKLVPEKMEGAVLKVVSKKVIDEFVEWTVGHVSEKLAGEASPASLA
eukprot:jgi/Undpi1/6755/HiC_scaffold_21.g09234.m1